jgi:hypothetical protein
VTKSRGYPASSQPAPGESAPGFRRAASIAAEQLLGSIELRADQRGRTSLRR